MAKATYIHGTEPAEQSRLARLGTLTEFMQRDDASSFFYWNRAAAVK